MSLIDEALKRARMEAAQKAAEQEGLPYPTIPRHLGPQRRNRWLVPLAVALAVAGGVLVGLLLASRGGPPAAVTADGGIGGGPPVAAASDPIGSAAGASEAQPTAGALPSPAAEESPEADATPAPTPAEPRPRPAPPAGDRSAPGRDGGVRPVEPPPAARAAPPAAPAGASAAISQAPATRQSEAPSPTPQGPASTTEPTPQLPATADPPPGVEPRPAPPARPPAASTPAAATPTPSAAAMTDPDSGVLLTLPERRAPTEPEQPAAPDEATAERHTRSLPLPDGGAIELGGIAWSETGPFALINGRVVGPGAVIDGYTLEQIRPGHVELTGEGRRIHLSLR